MNTATAPAPGPGAGGTLRLTAALPPPPPLSGAAAAPGAPAHSYGLTGPRQVPGYPAAVSGRPPGAAPGPPSRPARRRVTTLVIAGIAILLVAGLTAYAHPPRARSTGRSSAAPGVGSSVRDGKFQFTVTAVGHATSAGDTRFGLAVKARGEYTLVHVTVINVGPRSQVLTDTAQYVYDAAGRKYSASSRADIALDGGSVLFNAINPGNTVRAVFAFDMPAGAKAVAIELHDSLFSGGVTVSLR